VWDDGLEILFYEMMDGRPGLEKHDAVICDFSGMTDAAVYGWPGLICERPGGSDRSPMIYGIFVGRAARIRRCLICLAGLRCLDKILQDFFYGKDGKFVWYLERCMGRAGLNMGLVCLGRFYRIIFLKCRRGWPCSIGDV
jgi:hypothetical protein